MEELARRYLGHRRQFGYRLFSQSYGLLAFARFADQTAPGQPITVAPALRWATRQPALPITVASRLSIIRGFAGYCATFDPRTETVPARLTNQVPRRQAPHIYSIRHQALFSCFTRQPRVMILAFVICVA